MDEDELPSAGQPEESNDELRAVQHAARSLKLRADEQAGHDQRIRTAEEELAAWAEARRAGDEYRTVAEREKEKRLELYTRLKARGALDVYYRFYPDERPKGEKLRGREDEGRER